MAYAYLVKQKSTGKRQLLEASSPSIAIAEAAKDDFTAQRVEGEVLDMLRDSLPLVKVGRDATPAAGDPPADDTGKDKEPAADPKTK